ncbi:MAG: GerMN domain-containing protein [Defluviitaleaceae bacterium]|nr:GerMN domain-containing protein [Defluviitaleaceae bacterium]
MKTILICLYLVLLQIFYYNADGDFAYYNMTVPAYFTTEQQAWVVFSKIFNNINPDKMTFVPPNVQILNIWFENGALTLNLSSDVIKYGGTYFEHRFVEKLLKNAAQLPASHYITILTEGRARHLPEGIKIFREPLY